LDLSINNIKDISPLRANVNLRSLIVDANPITVIPDALSTIAHKRSS